MDIQSGFTDPCLAVHEYDSHGEYTIVIWVWGTITGFSFKEKWARADILRISEWGLLLLGDGGKQFNIRRWFEIEAKLNDRPRLSHIRNMNYMFLNASVFNSDLSGWDTSAVTIMDHMFFGASAFNGDVSGWNTAAVTRMDYMFSGASAFNGDVSGWDTARVTDMSGMFIGASSFNSDLSGWDTAHVMNMCMMFCGASAFKCDLSGWDTKNVRGKMLYNQKKRGRSKASRM